MVGGVKVLTDGGWHHVAAVSDGGTSEIRLYVDGNLENSHSVSYSTGFDFSALLNIGWLNSGSGYHFLGSLDEIALYNRALSDIEIRSHYYLVRGYCDMCATPVKIMPLGDSITEGCCNGQTNDQDDNYMASYRQKLYLDLTGAGYGVNFVGSLQSGNLLTPAFDTDHEGHAGYTAASCPSGAGELLPNVYNWLTANPADVVLLHIGTNDINYNCQSAANVSSVLDEIYRYNRDITVLLARIINQKTPIQAVTDFNNSVEAMAKIRIANGDRIVIVDQEHALTYPDDISASGPLHPTQAGYDKMAVPWLLSLNNFLPACVTTTTTINAPSVTYNADGIVTVTVSSTLTPTGKVFLTVDGGAALTQTPNSISGSNPPSSSATFTITKLRAGTHTLIASFASQGNLAASTVNGTLDITARPLTITATAANRMYDRTTTVSVTYGDNRLTGDVLTVNGVASFVDKNVGTAKAVAITNITITGIDSGNYALTATTASTTADIIAPDGDLDGDGAVSVTDALRALRIAGGLIIPTDADNSHGDVAPLVSGMPQPNDSIDIGDVVVILRKAVGLVNW